ncbi:UPF0280 family protein [Candidatus Woesearchaeota archaeon]|nr:UPF0280 family protein [Candidatus Woesearchaeota archaeon]
MNLIKAEKKYKDTHVKILTDKEKYVDFALDEIINQRKSLENYIKNNPKFLSSLKPIKAERNSPKIVKMMAEGAEIAGVGPMAAVAGTISEFAVRKMVKQGAKVALVENGGDIFVVTDRKLSIGLFAGQSAIKDKLAFQLEPNDTPIAICSSSSKLGHSLSYGDCDLVTVFSKKSSIADAVATASCNKVKKESDIEKVLEWAASLEGVKGIIIVKNKKVGINGDVPKLVPARDLLLKDKITKEEFYQV